MKNRYITMLIVTFSLLTSNFPLVSAESEFGLRLSPAFRMPLGLEQFSPGMGADVSVDWTFLNFSNNTSLGLSFGGTFASIPVNVGDPLTLMEGNAGPILRWRPFDRWAFQAGLNAGVYQHSRGEDSGMQALFGGALGAQYHLSPYFSLYAEGGYTYRIFAAQPLNTLDFRVGLRLNLSEIMGGRDRVSIEKTQQYRVFPVSWAWYEHNPVAMVQVTNEESNAITDVNLSFYMDSYMNQPWTFAVLPRLAPGETVEVPVTALFNEAMMNLSETVSANGYIQMQYRSLGARKETTTSIQMPIFHRNTLSWDDDRRAAAFVSPRDSAARLFARYVAAALETHEYTGNTPSNVRHAAALFEALRLYGISYVVVPATSFANVSADESVLDNVSFPYQALYYRGGDCSYLSILFCSMLEALNIESAFITIPGHIYIAFETGDDDWYASSDDIIELEGRDGIRRRWLPVEITVPGEGFLRAWRIGALQWHNNRQEAALFPIREAWEIYPPVTAPNSGDRLPEMPQWGEILSALENEINAFGWTEQMAAAAMEQRQRLAENLTRREQLAAEINASLKENNIEGIFAEATNQGVMIRVSNIRFLDNSAQLMESGIEKISEFAAVLSTLLGRRTFVTGNAATGSTEDEYISLERARTVMSILAEHGVGSESDMETMEQVEIIIAD